MKEKNIRNQEFMMMMMIYQSEELDKDYGLYSSIHTSITWLYNTFTKETTLEKPNLISWLKRDIKQIGAKKTLKRNKCNIPED